MTKSVKINDNLYVDRSLFDFLINSNNIISALILSCETITGPNYFAPSVKEDMVTYLPANKFKEELVESVYDDGIGRSSMKVGKLATKLLPKKVLEISGVNNTIIENFVNQYKSWFDKSLTELKVIEGEEIRQWYLDENYLCPGGNKIGSLWKSCMRYNERQKFLDLYCSNDNIKMLVMITKDNGVEKVRSRALLWDDVVVTSQNDQFPENIKVMDRIYSVFDSDVYTFKKWADDNGYIPKYEQNAKSHQFFDVKGNPVRIKCKIQINNFLFQYYPYLDTFPFFNIVDGVVYNDQYAKRWDYKLVQADGRLERVEEDNYDDNYEEDAEW